MSKGCDSSGQSDDSCDDDRSEPDDAADTYNMDIMINDDENDDMSIGDSLGGSCGDGDACLEGYQDMVIEQEADMDLDD